MELKDFIKRSLYDICTGISEASETIHKELNNTPLAPHTFNGKENPDQQREIEFDIAVTVSEKTGKKAHGNVSAGGIIKVVGLGAGGHLSSEKLDESTSRIKFKIPFFPGATRKGRK